MKPRSVELKLEGEWYTLSRSGSLGSAVGTGFECPQKQEIFIFSKTSRPALGLPILLLNGHQKAQHVPIVYVQYTSWWWATNMPETCRVDWRNELTKNSTSSWFSLHGYTDTGTGVRSTGVMRPGRESDNSPAPSNGDKDGWSLELYFPYMALWHVKEIFNLLQHVN